jgi:hypothetical protein
VLVTDEYIMHPVTGVRGVTDLPAWCVATSFDFSTGVGRCVLLFAPDNVT